MAIKRPVTRPAAREPEEDDEQPAPKKKVRPPVDEDEEPTPKKKKPAPVEEDDDEPAPKKKPAPVEEDDDEQPAPRKGSSLKKKKKKAPRSLADVFDKTKPGGNKFPVGQFQAYVANLELEGEIAEEIEDQGPLVAKIQFEGHEDEDDEVAGKTLNQRYTIVGKDGEINDTAIGILKQDLEVLGYEEVMLGDLEEIFADIVAERPLVVIKTKQNGNFTNAYIQGVPE